MPFSVSSQIVWILWNSLKQLKYLHIQKATCLIWFYTTVLALFTFKLWYLCVWTQTSFIQGRFLTFTFFFYYSLSLFITVHWSTAGFLTLCLQASFLSFLLLFLWLLLIYILTQRSWSYFNLTCQTTFDSIAPYSVKISDTKLQPLLN